MPQRILTQVVRGRETVDGAGVKLRRVLGPPTIKDFDPFLMLDGFDSRDPADYVAGFLWHPHRGIETVTYLISGRIEHQDSLGNSGTIGELQCQWMTAGSGILHQEMPQASERMLGCQLWVNLPAASKMCRPTYRDLKAQDIPAVSEGQARVRVLSGDYRGQKGPLENGFVEVRYLDVELAPGAPWTDAQTANGDTLFLFLIEGSLAIGENSSDFQAKPCALLLAAASGPGEPPDAVEVKAGPEGARFLLIAGKPLGEPVAWGGPIVMNSQEELDQAFAELDAGTFIKEAAV